MSGARRGHYLGTEVDETWWRRYRGSGFFARGNGEYWLEDRELCFLRYLTSEPLRIPYDRIRAVKVGTSHAGRWTLGRPIVKVLWQDSGTLLSSGFEFPKGAIGAQEFLQQLAGHLPGRAMPHVGQPGA